MKRQCEEIEKLLGPWLDRELSQAEAQQVETHLEECHACSRAKEQLERLQNSLKSFLEARASGVSFEPFWRELQERILEQKPWYGALWDWARLALYPPRLTWAIPLVIVLLLAILSLEQFVPGWGLGPGRNNLAAVESIDGHGLNVAVFRESKTKTTVIWLFQNQEEENESSEESAPSDNTF